MSTIRVVGIDIAKSVFQVCVWMANDYVAWNKKISRSKLLNSEVSPTLAHLYSINPASVCVISIRKYV